MANLRDTLRYRFDNLMSRGLLALLLALFGIGAAVAVTIAVLVWATGIGPPGAGLWKLLWTYTTRALSVALDTSGGFLFMLLMLLLAFTGMFVGGSFIGVIGSAILGRLQELRKGRSRVLEKDHTLILGWSPHIFSILAELVTANESRKRATIVILAEKGKVEMEDAIRARLPDPRTTRIVCRTGSPIDMTDLALVSPKTARSIIVLGPDVQDPDAEVIKTVLALTNDPARGRARYHIVVELERQANLEVLRMIAPDEVRPVLADDLIARITVQTCRQAGLSAVYNELLDFAGQEVYMVDAGDLVGRTFREALFAYQNSSPLGLWRDGAVQYLPSFETRLAAGDRLVVVAEDDSSIARSNGGVAVQSEAIRRARPPTPAPEQTLILGWNRRSPLIVSELDAYVAPGSLVTVVSGTAPDEVVAQCGPLVHLTIDARRGDTTDRRLLDALEVSSYHHVITLSPGDAPTPQAADARTLVTLLHLRDIGRRVGHGFSIVSEMLDVRNRELAEVTRADDFIVSDRLVSLVISQLAENRDLTLSDLFDAEGSELYLKPAAEYVELGKPISYWTVVESAARRGEIAVGLRRASDAADRAKSYGVAVNPPRGEPFTFDEEDRILVLAVS